MNPSSPPTAEPCLPARPPKPPNFHDPQYACEWVYGLWEAYNALISGNTRTTVKVADRETRYSRGDAPLILQQLKAMVHLCPTFPVEIIPGRIQSFSPINAYHRAHRHGF